jgi:hypothetical protein
MSSTRASGTGWPAGETVPADRRLPPGGAIALFLDRIAAAEAVLAKVPVSVPARIPPEAENPPGAEIPVKPSQSAVAALNPAEVKNHQGGRSGAPGSYREPGKGHPGRHRRKRDSRKRALRGWQLLSAVLLLIVLGTGSAMIVQHGFAFFVFRAGGTGQSPGSFLQENQGPGQPDASAAKPDQPAKPAMLTATAPDGTRITVPLKPGLAWAGIAQRRLDGGWTVIDDGASQAAVRQATAIHFNRHPGEYAAAWTVVPLRRT